MAAEPVRARTADGRWAALDARLVGNADGSLSPKLSASRLTLSGGGTGPLAVLHRGGKRLAVSWPTKLPKPAVSGATAIYAAVLPGVDLQVTADTSGGFSHVLVIKNAEAAHNPALATLTLGTSGKGVRVKADRTGNLSATDAAGHLVFHTAAPVMWDTPPPRPQPQRPGPRPPVKPPPRPRTALRPPRDAHRGRAPTSSR